MDDFFTEDLCFDNRKEGEGGAPTQRSPILRMSAWAIRAAAAGHALVEDDLAIKVVLGLDNAANEHPAVHAGVGALEAGVVRFYGVVVFLSR
jgi:hypothetical protein